MRTARHPDVEPVAKQIAAEVRAELARQGVTQQALSEKLGWLQPRLSRRLADGRNGLIPFTAAELLAVAEALGVPVARLLPESEAAR